MMALPAAFPLAGIAFNFANDTVDVPNAHLLNAFFPMISTANAAAGTRDIPITVLQGLALSLSRRNPNNAGELDNISYGMHALDLPAIFQTLEAAVNIGFSPGLAVGNTPFQCGFAILRKAHAWAQANASSLRPLMAADFYALPALPAGAIPVQLRMSYALLVEPSNLLMRAAAEIVGLAGYVHTVASRTANSRFTHFFQLVVDQLGNPAVASQPNAVAHAILHSGMPVELLVYPEFLGERYPHTLLRLHYVAGSLAERRAGFSSYVGLLNMLYPSLSMFLLPSTGTDQMVDSYIHMARAIFPPNSIAPTDQSLFHLPTASSLSALLAEMPGIPAQANGMVPPANAAWRSHEAVTEWARRRSVAGVGGQGAVVADQINPDGPPRIVASRGIRQQMLQDLLPMPFFGPADAQIVRLQAAAPLNDFPLLKLAVDTRNVIFMQVAVGRLSGVADVAPSLRIVEGAAQAFPKFVDHYTVMDKAPLITAGTRQPHTLSYNQESFTRLFLGNNRDRFLKLDFLGVSNAIRCAREQTLTQALKGTELLFEEAENLLVLDYFSHYLEPFGFNVAGPGSWSEGIDRLAKFRANGLAMPGQSKVEHFRNCLTAYHVLLGELFDAVSHFAQSKEAPNVQFSLTRLVYESGSAFDDHIKYQNAATAQLNQFLLLNPAFQQVLGGSSSGGGTSRAVEDHDAEDGGRGSSSKLSKISARYHFTAAGDLYFGKGNKGPCYDANAVLKEIQKVVPNASRKSFCIINYLSTQFGTCQLAGHSAKCRQHIVSKAVRDLRPKFEFAPFRKDGKGKAAPLDAG
jgi:hypothetical protein